MKHASYFCVAFQTTECGLGEPPSKVRVLDTVREDSTRCAHLEFAQTADDHEPAIDAPELALPRRHHRGPVRAHRRRHALSFEPQLQRHRMPHCEASWPRRRSIEG
ncbi:hypothetical protein G6O69_01440 [Pseudenhygromyxa sp. WMMC2535]|uniref:hypothetical protein n=1 Tax=Pseudenhygromyxa sp. WMMC2535 TaxID=2712867 RepID=UPI001596131A|nr:hypothetical protein [Pseudenhygromyxa sp. WMMC2535]NVB36476.1 hypothetical protein [Pseudenhygromyxa sp. WMMC2535]